MNTEDDLRREFIEVSINSDIATRHLQEYVDKLHDELSTDKDQIIKKLKYENMILKKMLNEIRNVLNNGSNV